MEIIYQKVGLRRVINASGRMTALGVSTIHDETGKTMVEAAQNYVVIDELIDRVGELLCPFTGADGTCVTANTSAAICLSIAAVMTGSNLDLVEKIPDTTGLKNQVIIQKGHCVNYGAPVTQMIRTVGAIPVEVGCANKVDKANIIGAINDKTAALMYVKSHHCVQKGMVSLADMIKIAHGHDLPLIVDASAEEDLKKYIAMGADLVCYSGAKAIEGPTSGFICGRKDLTDAAKLHYKGIGRSMKIGKESMMGLLKAVEIYTGRDMAAHEAQLNATVDQMIHALTGLPHIQVGKSWDEAGRNISRCRVDVESSCPLTALEIVAALKDGDPAIYTRDHFANVGTIFFDPRPILPGDVEAIAEKMKKILEG